MRQYERKGKQYRGEKKTSQRSSHLLWHRALAGLVAAVTILTGIEMPGLENVFAEETSGYQIDVSYSEESNQVTLTGNMENVPSDITLLDITDEDGTEYEPDEFTATVAENGIYTYTLTYSEAVPETGKTVEKEEAVDVVVDEVEEPAEETDQEETATDDTEETDQEEVVTEETEGSDQDTTEAESQETETVVAEEQQEITSEVTGEVQVVSRNAASSTIATDNTTVSGASTRATVGGYDFDATKKWSKADFTETWHYGSNTHMNYNTNPTDGSVISRELQVSDTSNGPKFTFGQQMGSTRYGAHWLQQSAAFSDITFDFNRDFALKGTMRVGNSFGATSDATDDTDIKIDGGMTISFVHKDYQGEAIQAAQKANGAGYRLGAYRVLPYAVVLEYDTSTDTYYEPNDKRNFVVGEEAIHETGDYNYANSGNAFPNYNGYDIYDWAAGSSHYENITHIGVSGTNVNGVVESSSYTSPRVMMGTSNTGSIDYTILYKADTKEITFTVREDEGEPADYRTVTYNLTNFFNKLSQEGGSGREMKLAITSGAAYMDIDQFISGTSYFTNGTGTIDVWVNEMLVNPDLSTTSTDVRWLSSYDQVSGANTSNNAYYNSSSSTVYNNRELWPVEGDRVYVQVGFVPTTNLMPQVGSANTGTLKVSVDNVSIVDQNGNQITGATVSNSPPLYRRTGTVGSYAWQNYNSATGITVDTMGYEYAFRVQVNLPKLTDNSYAEYYVEGNLKAVYNVGSSQITYTIPFSTANNNRLPISRNPRFVRWNGINYNEQVRVITSADGLSDLTNTAPGGTQDSDGNNRSIHYGAGYRLGSATSPAGLNGSAVGVKFTYQSAKMSDLTAITINNNVGSDASISLTEDTRYILEYALTDSTYSSKAQNLTGNAGRGTASGTRIIWNSDNVKVENGYEFYMSPTVTMSISEFDGFLDSNGNVTSSDKGGYYRKIAAAANIVVYNTANADWSNLAKNDASTVNPDTISGNGTAESHNLIKSLINTPGNTAAIPIQFKSGNVVIEKTVNVTLTEDTPKVVSNVDGTNTIDNQDQSKIIFDRENYTVSATFKLVNSDGTLASNLTDEEWTTTKTNIKVALYKQNGTSATGSKDKFYRWANEGEATNNGKDSNHNPKLDVPPQFDYDEDKGTFTVTYTIWNSSDAVSSANWVTKTWEDGANWKIFAYTDTNRATNDYANLSQTALETVELNSQDSDVPSVTTAISLIEKDNGNLPTTMFVISDVVLNDNGIDLTDRRDTTTISLKQVTSNDTEAEHDYYYDISVNEDNVDELNRPYTILTQSDTAKQFNATYLRYTDSVYEDVTNDNLELGSIAFPSNQHSIPSSIRFGMRADRPNGLSSNTRFMGMTHFKFTRESLHASMGGGNL